MHEMFMFMCLSIIIFVDTFRLASLLSFHPQNSLEGLLVVGGKFDAERKKKVESSGRFELVLFTAL
jgi:hypothetical protein